MKQRGYNVSKMQIDIVGPSDFHFRFHKTIGEKIL